MKKTPRLADKLKDFDNTFYGGMLFLIENMCLR